MTDWSIYKYTIMNAKATTKLRNNTMSRTQKFQQKKQKVIEFMFDSHLFSSSSHYSWYKQKLSYVTKQQQLKQSMETVIESDVYTG